MQICLVRLYNRAEEQFIYISTSTVLRTSEQKSIFNGENQISDSGSYEAVGTTFDYHRIDGVQQGEGVTEWITSTGPIRDAVELLVRTA